MQSQNCLNTAKKKTREKLEKFNKKEGRRRKLLQRFDPLHRDRVHRQRGSVKEYPGVKQ